MSDRYHGFAETMDSPIREVIEAELSKRGGGMLTGYIGLFTYIDEDGDQCWAQIGSVPMIQGVGMADLLQMSVRADAQRSMGFEQ